MGGGASGKRAEQHQPRGIGSPRFRGTLCVIAAAIGFGALGIFVKAAFASGASIVSVLFLRFFIAGILLVILMMTLRLPWPHGRNLWQLAGLAFGYVGQTFCYFSTLHHASAGMAVLLLYLYPSLVMIVSVVLGRQRLTCLKLFLAVTSLIGILLTVSGDLGGATPGIVFGIGSAVLYALFILAGERLIPRVGAIPASTVVILTVAAVYAVATLATAPRWPADQPGWWAIGGIALVSTVIPITGLFAGIARLGATDAATLSTLEPIVTLLLAFFFLGETLKPVQLLGAALVILAVVVLTRVR